MSTPVVPSLGLGGFIRDVPAAADKIISYYLTTDKSQSNLFNGSVFSLQSQIQAHYNDPTRLVAQVRDELRNLMLTVTDQANVEVTTQYPSPIDPTRLNLTVRVDLNIGGRIESLGRIIETLNGQVKHIMDFANNGGSL